MQSRKNKPRSDCLGQVNCVLEQVKREVLWPDGQVKLTSVVLWICLNENVSLINDNFQSEAISELKTGGLVTIELKAWISWHSSRHTLFTFVLWLPYSLPRWLVIFKWGQVKTENYWPTGQVDFKVFFAAQLWWQSLSLYDPDAGLAAVKFWTQESET